MQNLEPQIQSIRPMDTKTERILDIVLDTSINTFRTPEVEHEYSTAVADLLQENYFHLCKNPGGDPVARGPYNLYLSIQENRLVMDIRRLVQDKEGNLIEKIKERVAVPVSPFRSIIKDYFFLCENYYSAIKGGGRPSQLETLDMARRGMHNEAAELLQNVLIPNVNVDFQTARRLFTLLCVLHIR